MTSTISQGESLATASESGVELGSRVVSSDGKRLGSVSDLRGPYFKVHRNFLAGDFWLDVGDVVAVFDDEVILAFEKRSMGDHRVDDDVVKDERLDGRVDHLLDQTAMQEQRERMERELTNGR